MTIFIKFNVIFAWHGLWTIMDIWTEEQNISNDSTALISLGIGTFANLVIFLIQFPYAVFTDDLFRNQMEVDNTPSIHYIVFLEVCALIFGYIISFLSLISTVHSFRGYWYLMDEYFMPGEENYEKSLVNSQIYGALILFVFHISCSLHPGIYKDLSPDKGGNLREYYYSTYFYIKVL